VGRDGGALGCAFGVGVLGAAEATAGAVSSSAAAKTADSARSARGANFHWPRGL
jgi:hypothetical protein